jgi:hypothetical protein
MKAAQRKRTKTKTNKSRNRNSGPYSFPSAFSTLSRFGMFAEELEGTCFRRARVTISEREALAEDSAEALRKKELEAEQRRKQSHDLVAESIKRELAESTYILAMLLDLFPINFG